MGAADGSVFVALQGALLLGPARPASSSDSGVLTSHLSIKPLASLLRPCLLGRSVLMSRLEAYVSVPHSKRVYFLIKTQAAFSCWALIC